MGVELPSAYDMPMARQTLFSLEMFSTSLLRGGEERTGGGEQGTGHEHLKSDVFRH